MYILNETDEIDYTDNFWILFFKRKFFKNHKLREDIFNIYNL